VVRRADIGIFLLQRAPNRAFVLAVKIDVGGTEVIPCSGEGGSFRIGCQITGEEGIKPLGRVVAASTLKHAVEIAEFLIGSVSMSKNTSMSE
jgi:hypothetical protein